MKKTVLTIKCKLCNNYTGPELHHGCDNYKNEKCAWYIKNKEMKNETLLKDMPIHMERIENNYLLGEEIKDSLMDIEIDTDFDKSFEDDICRRISSVLRDEAEFEIENGKVLISNHEDLAQLIYKELLSRLEDEVLGVENKDEMAIKIRESLIEFVNHNYIFKGI